ncbi:MAG: hypothetical protein AAFU59_16145 [Pseudomonadota bacterium]
MVTRPPIAVSFPFVLATSLLSAFTAALIWGAVAASTSPQGFESFFVLTGLLAFGGLVLVAASAVPLTLLCHIAYPVIVWAAQKLSRSIIGRIRVVGLMMAALCGLFGIVVSGTYMTSGSGFDIDGAVTFTGVGFLAALFIAPAVAVQVFEPSNLTERDT